MDFLDYLQIGFSTAFQPTNLLYCFFGVLIGTLIGVLPGLGPVGAMSLLFPVTFKASPESAIIMLSGIYYGAMYGGSTTSILVNIPGEAASVVTCLDGYQMARQGRAGPALGISALGSFIGGTLSLVGLMLLAPPLSQFALRFGPAEYFSLMVLGLTILAYLAHGSILKAMIMAVFGLVLGLVGLDSISGLPRLTLGRLELLDGLGLVPILIGLFGVSEILVNLETHLSREIYKTRIEGLFPTIGDWVRSAWPIARGAVLGFFLGILPGGGVIIASFASYGIEKRLSRSPERFGKGAIEGVAGPETANNAATGGAFIPLMTLGIPSNVVMALLLGAFMVHGISPGPLLMQEHPSVFWGVIASMYIGNLMLLVLNLPLIGMWVQVLKVPYTLLFPIILLLCVIGAYTVNNRIFDIHLMLIFSVFGYLMRKFGYEGAPLIFAFVLGPLFENNFRKSLIISQGDFSIFFTRPLSLVCLLAAIFVILSPLVPRLARQRSTLSSAD